MLRHSFDQKLQTLQGETLALGQMVDQALGAAVEALIGRDVARAQLLIAYTCGINDKRAAVEAETWSLIATQQPVAGDLRTLIAVLEIAAELQQMGGYAAGIAQAAITMRENALPQPIVEIMPKMAEKAQDMLRQSLLAFAQRDVVLARAIPLQDDEVDYFYNQVYQVLLATMRSDPSPHTANQAACLSRAAHYLERTADRVLNICEWLVFAVTGEMAELNDYPSMSGPGYHTRL
jgi:phosphate transport system protein